MRKIILGLVLVVAMLCEVNAAETNTIKILTIGNSFADNATSQLGAITRSVPSCKIVIGRANIGGSSLEMHAKLIKDFANNPNLKPYYNKYSLKDLLLKDKWDVVTIQQVSHLSHKPETYQPHADIIVAFVKEFSPNSEIVIHQTWAYSPKCPRLASWKLERSDMQSDLVKSYDGLAKRYDARNFLSGNAFYESYNQFPEINLWNSDGYHANQNGCYLAGCVWFGELFGVSPEKVTWKPKNMSEEVAKKIRKVASKICLN